MPIMTSFKLNLKSFLYAQSLCAITDNKSSKFLAHHTHHFSKNTVKRQHRSKYYDFAAYDKLFCFLIVKRYCKYVQIADVCDC